MTAVWNVDCLHRRVPVSTSMVNVVVLGENDTITGGETTAELSVPVADFLLADFLVADFPVADFPVADFPVDWHIS